jgi:hypothetical protein
MKTKRNSCLLLNRSIFSSIFNINKNFVYSSRLGFRLNAFAEEFLEEAPKVQMIIATEKTIESSKNLFDCTLVNGKAHRFLATSSNDLYRFLYVILNISVCSLEPENDSDVPRQAIQLTVLNGDYDDPEIRGFLIIKSYIFPVPDALDFITDFPSLPQLAIFELRKTWGALTLESIYPIWALKNSYNFMNNSSFSPENLINFEFPDGMTEKEFLKPSSKNLIRGLYVVLKIQPISFINNVHPPGFRLTVTNGLFRSFPIEVGYSIIPVDLSRPTNFITEFPPLPQVVMIEFDPLKTENSGVVDIFPLYHIEEGIFDF